MGHSTRAACSARLGAVDPIGNDSGCKISQYSLLPHPCGLLASRLGMDITPVTERAPMGCADDAESPAQSPMESPRPTASHVERPSAPAAPTAPMFIPGRGVSLAGDGMHRPHPAARPAIGFPRISHVRAVTMTYEEEASPPTSHRPAVPQPPAEMTQSSILEKRHLLSNLSSKVSHVAQVRRALLPRSLTPLSRW